MARPVHAGQTPHHATVAQHSLLAVNHELSCERVSPESRQPTETIRAPPLLAALRVALIARTREKSLPLKPCEVGGGY